MKKDLKYYINRALKEGFALGALNFSNLECLQGILDGAKELKSPIIISVSEGALAYMGEDFCKALGDTARKNKGVFLHLDHGKSYEVCKKAIDLGFDSVMIDASALPLEENIKLTRKVANYAHKKGLLCEGELGQIKGKEDQIDIKNNHFTRPQDALNFVQKTNVDLLAVAVGTSHGAYKHNGEPTIHYEILKEIGKLLPNFPLVLHGASAVKESVVEKINMYGGDLQGAVGMPDRLIKKAVKEYNIAKINSDTDLRMAVTAAVREKLAQDKKVFDPRVYLGNAREEVKKVTMQKIKSLFGSAGKL